MDIRRILCERKRRIFVMKNVQKVLRKKKQTKIVPKLTCAMMNRDNASLNTIRTVSPFSHELTDTHVFVHKRARYSDLDRDDGSLVDL